MRYCKKCVMPDTRPGITFNEAGICSGCQSYPPAGQFFCLLHNPVSMPRPV